MVSLNSMGSSCIANFHSTIDIVNYVTCMINRALIPLLITAGLIFFIYHIVRFIGAADDAKRADAKMYMLWGIIAFAIIVTVWGLVKILGGALGITTVIPQFPTGQ